MNRKIQQQKKELTSEQINHSVMVLSSAFEKAIAKWPSYKNHKGTILYDLQVEFCWLMHELTNGPVYFAPVYMQQLNELIEKAEKTPKD